MTNIGVIIQARSSSSRLPGKVLKILDDEPMIVFQANRLLNQGIKNVVVATSLDPSDNPLCDLLDRSGIPFFRGSLSNVLNRYFECAKYFRFDTIIRVCGDDPLIDPNCVLSLIASYANNYADYITAHHRKGWIYGTSAELFSMQCLTRANHEAVLSEDLEHVNPWMERAVDIIKRKISDSIDKMRPDILLSIDYQEDFDLLSKIIYDFRSRGISKSFKQEDLIETWDRLKLSSMNSHLHNGFDN